MKALIIGNGGSRKGVNLTELSKGYDLTIGCNLIYKEFVPDKILIMDYAILERLKSEAPELIDKAIFPIGPVRLEETTGRSSNSGSIAMMLALLQGADQIDMLGFDSLILSKSNIYTGEKGYFIPTDDDIINRRKYFKHFTSVMYSHTEYNFLFPPEFVEEANQALKELEMSNCQVQPCKSNNP